MTRVNIGAFGMDRYALADFFRARYGKGAYHAEALFRHLYSSGSADVRHLKEFQPAPSLASRAAGDLEILYPRISAVQEEEGTRKIALELNDGARIESVVIPMSGWHTLCISSQVGCARGCRFCETARMGWRRNLDTAEIVVQWAAARFHLGVEPRNLVYMGMGEPFDNFDSLVSSIRILSDPRGAGIPKRRISISTAGNVEGIRRLAELEKQRPDEAWRTIHLAVSLNAASNEVRSSLMPINRQWPLEELKSALLETPQSALKDALYFEYVIIPGVNDSVQDAEALVEWMDGLAAKVNLIPYHPRRNSPWKAPSEETVNRFYSIVRQSGRECRTRLSRGEAIQAACGMLGGKSPSA